MKKLETIYVIFTTHVDIGFTGLAKEVMESYKTNMMNDVLNVCEATQIYPKGHRYVWTMPAWPLLETIRDLPKEKLERVEKLIEENQLAWQAFPFTTHTEFCGVEEFIRGLYCSKQLSDKYNKKIISAKMTDVPGHTWMLPSILHKAGVQFLQLGCNSCSMPPDVPRLFNWEGPDGNRVLTFYSKGAYGSDILPPEDWEYPIWMALQQTHDNHGPQPAEIIENILKEVEEKSPGTKVVVGTMDDFAKDFLQRDYDNIPVLKKDLADTWIHGVGTYPQEVSTVRKIRTEIANYEMVETLENMQGENENEALKQYNQHVKNAYGSTLMFGEHTWGLDMKITLLPMRNGERVYDKERFLKDKESEAYKRAEASWDEQREYVGNAVKEVDKLHSLKVGKDRIEKNDIISIFNPLAWERKQENITLEGFGNGYLVDLETGEKHKVVECKGDGLVQVTNIPALGHRKFQCISQEHCIGSFEQIAKKEGHEVVLENEWVCVKINEKTGAISSLYDKVNKKEWIKNDENINFGEYTYDIYGKEDVLKFVKDYAYDLTDWYINDFGKAGYPRQKRKKYRNRTCNVSFDNGFGWGSILIEQITEADSYENFGNAMNVKTILTLTQDQKGIQIKYELLNKQETPFVEAGHFVFPLQTTNPQYRIQKMGSVVNPISDIQKAANSRIHCIDSWVDVEDGGVGICFIPIDTPLVSLGEQGIYQFSESYIPEKSTIYFNGFNNQWGTNFPQWIGGDFKFEYEIVLHKGNWKHGEVWKKATETIRPLKVLSNYATTNSFKQIQNLFKGEVKGIMILAIKPCENGDGYIIRFQDLIGENRSLNINFKETMKGIIECDILENEIEEVHQCRNNSIVLNIKPFEIRTLKLLIDRR